MLRVDGRRADELRPVKLAPHYTDYAEGSVLITAGGTRVLCNVTVEEGTPRWMQVQGKRGGWVTAEYAMLPRATQQRTPRESNGVGGRTHEIRRLVGRSLRAAIDLEKLGARTCIVDCDVLQADGGTRTAAITGGYVALRLALQKLVDAGMVDAGVFKDAVAAVSVGVIEGKALLDLCYAEDSRAQVDANVVMTAAGEFIEVQFTGESRTFGRVMLDDLLNLAYKGIGDLLTLQRETLDKCMEETSAT